MGRGRLVCVVRQHAGRGGQSQGGDNGRHSEAEGAGVRSLEGDVRGGTKEDGVRLRVGPGATWRMQRSFACAIGQIMPLSGGAGSPLALCRAGLAWQIFFSIFSFARRLAAAQASARVQLRLGGNASGLALIGRVETPWTAVYAAAVRMKLLVEFLVVALLLGNFREHLEALF